MTTSVLTPETEIPTIEVDSWEDSRTTFFFLGESPESKSENPLHFLAVTSSSYNLRKKQEPMTLLYVTINPYRYALTPMQGRAFITGQKNKYIIISEDDTKPSHHVILPFQTTTEFPYFLVQKDTTNLLADIYLKHLERNLAIMHMHDPSPRAQAMGPEQREIEFEDLLETSYRILSTHAQPHRQTTSPLQESTIHPEHKRFARINLEGFIEPFPHKP